MPTSCRFCKKDIRARFSAKGNHGKGRWFQRIYCDTKCQGRFEYEKQTRGRRKCLHCSVGLKVGAGRFCSESCRRERTKDRGRVNARAYRMLPHVKEKMKEYRDKKHNIIIEKARAKREAIRAKVAAFDQLFNGSEA